MSTAPADVPPDTEERHAGALAALRDNGHAWWREWNHQAIASACDALSANVMSDHPEAMLWRAVAAFMAEGADALDYLDRAWRGYHAAGHADGCAVAAHAALVFCLLDPGAMNGLAGWQARAEAQAGPAPGEGLDALWVRLGIAAAVALGQADSPAAGVAVAWLTAQVRAARCPLSPDERLIAALVLLEYRFATQRYEQIDMLANVIELPAVFDAASALMRGRWTSIRALVQFHLGDHVAAEEGLQRAMQIAALGNADSVSLHAALQLVRLRIDVGRIDEAHEALEAIRPQWGAVRTAQLISMLRLRARIQLLCGQPSKALATMEDALRLADDAGHSLTEKAGQLSDVAQIYLSLGRLDDALALLGKLAAAQNGREAALMHCMQGLLNAWRLHATDAAQSRQALADALLQAQRSRYTTFFRLLPAFAAELCSLALRWGIERPFVVETVRARRLPAPADADVNWPWPLWITMLGGFELRQAGPVQAGEGKAQHKPLELLRLLACERSLGLPNATAARALWPDADDDAAQRTLDVAVHRLRKLIGDPTLLRVHDGRVGLDAERVSSDVLQRRALLERIEALAMRPRDVADATAAVADECLGLVERVLEMSRGELLPAAPNAAWLEAERSRCRQDTVRAALAAAAVLERSELQHSERELLEAALRIEPLAEAVVRRLMLAYRRSGRRGDAVRVFELHRRQLDALGSAPGPQIAMLWRDLLASG